VSETVRHDVRGAGVRRVSALPALPVRTGRAVRRKVATVAPWLLGAAAVGCQIAFPFAGPGVPVLTITTVVLFAAACVSHALVQRGPAAAVALLAVAGGVGLVAEAVGIRTGVPFGTYEYTGRLGWELLGVPLVVPLAWTMMAYPAVLVGRRLVGWAAGWTVGRTADRAVTTAGRLATAAVGAWALASWDVFLDPQMVDAGHWRWANPEPGLPGVDGIPLTNFAGWLLVALVVSALLDAVLPILPAGRADDRLPAALYLWTYGSSVLAHLAFFGRPTVAVTGGLAMSLVAVPLAWSLWRERG
jgi:uncharacterized membrane protein